MEMKPIVKELRGVLSDIPDVWVRAWRDGEVRVGARPFYSPQIVTQLATAGFETYDPGKPGTSGEGSFKVRKGNSA